MREKYVWEVQLRNLGGPNYIVGAGKIVDDDGKEIAGQRGYKYYGRARELPGTHTFSTDSDYIGVKELLEAAKPRPETKKGRAELRRTVNADYYGYRDEEDGVLLQYEETQEEVAMGRTMENESGEPPEDWTPIGDVSEIPRQAEVADWLLERRKRRLMERYGG